MSSSCRRHPRPRITFEAPGKVQYHDKRLLVLFFDFSSMAVPDQLRAQDAALEYLKKSITKDDVVSVMLYTSTVQILTDFTQDRDILTERDQRLADRRSDRARRAGGYGRLHR